MKIKLIIVTCILILCAGSVQSQDKLSSKEISSDYSRHHCIPVRDSHVLLIGYNSSTTAMVKRHEIIKYDWEVKLLNTQLNEIASIHKTTERFKVPKRWVDWETESMNIKDRIDPSSIASQIPLDYGISENTITLIFYNLVDGIELVKIDLNTGLISSFTSDLNGVGAVEVLITSDSDALFRVKRMKRLKNKKKFPEMGVFKTEFYTLNWDQKSLEKLDREVNEMKLKRYFILNRALLENNSLSVFARTEKTVNQFINVYYEINAKGEVLHELVLDDNPTIVLEDANWVKCNPNEQILFGHYKTQPLLPSGMYVIRIVDGQLDYQKFLDFPSTRAFYQFSTDEEWIEESRAANKKANSISEQQDVPLKMIPFHPSYNDESFIIRGQMVTLEMDRTPTTHHGTGHISGGHAIVLKFDYTHCFQIHFSNSGDIISENTFKNTDPIKRRLGIKYHSTPEMHLNLKRLNQDIKMKDDNYIFELLGLNKTYVLEPNSDTTSSEISSNAEDFPQWVEQAKTKNYLRLEFTKDFHLLLEYDSIKSRKLATVYVVSN